ncbi:MAG TPA: hypothetical protein VLA91_00610 [Acidimicrobiia bacterium]|nr:hypothetical protein [Acidimicrobiia bacterium]
MVQVELDAVHPADTFGQRLDKAEGLVGFDDCLVEERSGPLDGSGEDEVVAGHRPDAGFGVTDIDAGDLPLLESDASHSGPVVVLDAHGAEVL